MIALFGFLESLINYGEEYEKIPKVIPYLVLPISAVLLVYRFFQAAIAIFKGEQDLLVASHELDEEDIEDAARALEETK